MRLSWNHLQSNPRYIFKSKEALPFLCVAGLYPTLNRRDHHVPAYYLFTLLDFLFLNFKDRLCLLIRRKDNVVSREKKISLVFFAEIAGIEPASHAVTGRHPSPVDLTSFILYSRRDSNPHRPQ